VTKERAGRFVVEYEYDSPLTVSPPHPQIEVSMEAAHLAPVCSGEMVPILTIYVLQAYVSTRGSSANSCGKSGARCQISQLLAPP
jgi:hypothetical protein